VNTCTHEYIIGRRTWYKTYLLCSNQIDECVLFSIWQKCRK